MDVPQVFPLGDGIGSVMLIRVSPEQNCDAAIAQAARVSYASGTKTVSDDATLIRYLMRHAHTSPFEMVEFVFILVLPLFVERQLIRHRTASVNEESARYSIVENKFYIPSPDGVRAQSKTNRQGSSAEKLPDEVVNAFIQNVKKTTEETYQRYLSAIESGVSRELARMLLPQNMYTKMVWKMDLHNLFHFLRLRTDSHAQYEIQCYAREIFKFVQARCPAASQAFLDYRVNVVNLPPNEVEALRVYLPSDKPPEIKTTSRTEKIEWEEKYKKLISH